MLHRLKGAWFLWGLLAAVTMGLAGHAWFLPLANLSWLNNGIVFTVMAMMAAPIPLELVRQTLGRPWPAVLASLVNLGFVPLLGWLGSRGLSPDLAGGIIVATAVPSTLTSAAVLARKAGGDDAVSIFATLITNVSCVVATPLWITLLIGLTVEVDLSTMVINLCLVVLLPILLVQLLRGKSVKFSRWADGSHGLLSVCCQTGILVMVFIGAVQMGARWSKQSLEAQSGGNAAIAIGNLGVIIGICLAIHFTAFAMAWMVAGRTGVARRQAKAVSFSASQKTLMIGLNLAIQCGVNIFPMVAYHILQLVFDALIAEKWGREKETSAN